MHATSDSNSRDDSSSILAQVCTKNSRWYSSKTVKWILHRPWVRIRFWRTVARSRSTQRCKPCCLVFPASKAISLGPQSMYSSIDFTCPSPTLHPLRKMSAMLLNMPTEGVSSGRITSSFFAFAMGSLHLNKSSMAAKAAEQRLILSQPSLS